MALERFHFTASDGTEFDVPFAYDKLRRKHLRRITKEHKDDPQAQEEAMLEACMSEKEIAQIDELTVRDYIKFIKGWMESDDDDDAPVGE